ncbi:MAG: hypothetical protein JWM62_2696, partial [Frankiales bacterium]|nr:hypothetical protein [Frankiales bacterium]
MTSPSYCAPCIADLALVREAVTTVAGTSSCMAHAVLLTHSSDDPGRRRQRLDALRDLANGKAETADPSEQAKLELLVQEYGLAGAMDMGGPARRAPQPQRQAGQHGQHGQPSAPGEGRKSRRGRPRPGDRPEGERGPRGEGRGEGRGERRPGAGETVPVTAAPGPAGEGAPVEAVEPSAPSSSEAPSAPSSEQSSAPEQTTPLAPQPAPEQSPA